MKEGAETLSKFCQKNYAIHKKVDLKSLGKGGGYLLLFSWLELKVVLEGKIILVSS